MKSKLKKAAILIAALVFWIGVWYLAAKMIGKSLILPTPEKVFLRLWELMGTASFYEILLFSLLRVILGFAISLFLGFFLGVLSFHLSPVRALVSPMMAIVRATPVASFILIILFWMKTQWVPAFTSFLMVLPIVWQNVLLGLEKRDGQILEMAKAFSLSPRTRFWKIDLPHLLSYVASAGKTGLGLAWKAGVAAEVLALSQKSIGYMIYNAKMYLEEVDLYAWTVAIILISVILEKIFSFLFFGRRRKNA